MLKRDSFLGTGILSKFIVRRDRIRLLIWLFGLAIFVAVLVPVFEDILLVSSDMTAIIETMKNPAMIAIVGPVYGEANYTLGAAYANYMLVFSAMFAGVMNIFLVSRHTRQDEELGRMEIIRSLQVGRLSNLASTLLVALIANVLLSILCFAGLYLLRGEGMSFMGCVIFGASMGVVGMFFAASTAVFCQLTSNNRTAMGLSFGFFMFLYVLRGIGDVSNETLSLISPLGLILRTENFVNDYFWPIAVVKVITIVLILFALWLNGNRDLGSGLLPERQGRRHASSLLSSNLGLAIKLLRTSFIVWGLTLFILAGMYGSVFGDLEGYLNSSDILRSMFEQMGSTASFTQLFTTMLMSIMSVISTVPVLNFMNRLSTEEKNGYTEHILSKSVSRYSQMLSYLIIALIASVVYQLLSAYGFWSVGSMVLEDIAPLSEFIKASLLYLPAVWVMIGLSALLIGVLPRITSLIYVYLGYSFLVVYLGKLLDIPSWTLSLTPFGSIPAYPIEEVNWNKLIILVVISVFLTIIGFISYRKRDIKEGH